jgi:hypothetical protein
LFTISLCINSCCTSTTTRDYSWKPTDDQVNHAEQVARSFALDTFKLDRSFVESMRVLSSGRTHEGNQIIYLRFYHPQHFNSKETAIVEGGFPYYFTISVDIESWKVVDSYASPE